MKMSSVDQQNISKIYEEKILVEMDVGGVVGGVPTSGNEIVNADDYATGDNRIPYLIGRVMTRNGSAKKRKKTKKLARKMLS